MKDAHDWFRAYRNMVHKAKTRNLPPVLFKHWFFLLGCTDDDGRLPGDLGETKNDMRMSRERLLAILDELVKRRFFDITEHGWVAHNWDKHQYKSDHSSNRVQTFRERQRNVTVTPPETETEQRQSSDPPDQQVDPSDRESPPLSAASCQDTFLSTTKKNEQVAALVDMAIRVEGIPSDRVDGGALRGVIKAYGHGRDVLDALRAYTANHAVGQLHEYMMKAVKDGRSRRTSSGYRSTGEQAGPEMEVATEGQRALTYEQYQALPKDQGVQGAGAGDGHDAEQGVPDPVPEREDGGRVVQRTGSDDG